MKLLIFIYGLLIGSFLNVCIFRIPKKESIAFPSSYCPKCKTKLKWYDNIPLLSFIVLRGKCRYCKDKISVQYPLVEFSNAILYLILYNHFGLSIDFIFYALISSVLVAITFIDLLEMLIPDSLVIIILILSILHKILNYKINGVSPNVIGSFIFTFFY